MEARDAKVATAEVTLSASLNRLLEDQKDALKATDSNNERLAADLAQANSKNQSLRTELQALKNKLALVVGDGIPMLLRIWTGKHTSRGADPEYRAIGKKPAGTTLSFMVEEVHPSKVKRYLAKSGSLKDEDMLSAPLGAKREWHSRSFLDITMGLISAHLYTLLGAQTFYVPKHRLHMAADDQITQGLHLLSRWIDDYQNLAALEACYLDQDDREPKRFQACLEAGRVPEYASIHEARVPILGLMEVLAASRLLGDPNVLGGHSKNAGFVVESQDGNPVAVRVVKINAGEAFSFKSDNQFTRCFSPLSQGDKLTDLKDLQFGSRQPRVILWGKLLDQQQERFLRALSRGYEALQDDRLLDFMIYRRGAFDKATPGRTLLAPKMVAEFKKAWCTYMSYQKLPQVYGTALAALPTAEMGPPQGPFRPKARGAAFCTFDEALALSKAP